MVCQTEFYGHLFSPVETPVYTGGFTPGSLAIYYPPNSICYRCSKCSVIVGIEGPSLAEATRVHLGFGSFCPQTNNFWETHWYCEGSEP